MLNIIEQNHYKITLDLESIRHNLSLHFNYNNIVDITSQCSDNLCKVSSQYSKMSRSEKPRFTLIYVCIFLTIFLQASTEVYGKRWYDDGKDWARRLCNVTQDEIRRSSPADSRIVGGELSPVIKYQLALTIFSSREPIQAQRCGGAPISPFWVLTAAHCITKSDGAIVTDIEVTGGISSLDPTRQTGQFRRVSQVKRHPSYDPMRLHANDIALLKVSEPFDFNDTKVEPIKLPTQSTPLDGEASISGFGCTVFDAQKCSIRATQPLRKAQVPLWSFDKCLKAWIEASENIINQVLSEQEKQELKAIFTNVVCAGGKHVGSCNGDSGGPLVVMENNRPVVIGVTSAGFKHMCGCDGIPVLYTKVLNYLKWIQDVQNGKDTSGHLLANVILVIFQLAYLAVCAK